MLTSENPNFDSGPRFRDTEPVELWSAKLALQIPYDQFERLVLTVSDNNNQGYTGFITTNEDSDVTSFTRTRYPRKKYGVTSIRECVSGMDDLATVFGGSIQQEDTKQGIRVVMGLLEGYDTASPTHSAVEVKKALPSASVSSADIFAVRRTSEGASVYTEPVAVIEGSDSLLPDILQVGDAFRQERFTIENFDIGLAYIVETRYCTEPD